MLRIYLALLGAGHKADEADGGKKTLDNAADPYMTFEVFHRSFHRTVEATSVTPFSPRALD